MKRKYNSQLPSKNKNAFQSDAYFPFVYRQGGSFMGHPSWNPPSWHPLHGNPFTAPLHRTPLHGTPSQIPLHGTHFMAPPSWKPPLQHPLHSTLSQNSLHSTPAKDSTPLLRMVPSKGQNSPCGQTNTSENITFQRLRLWAVITS